MRLSSPPCLELAAEKLTPGHSPTGTSAPLRLAEPCHNSLHGWEAFAQTPLTGLRVILPQNRGTLEFCSQVWPQQQPGPHRARGDSVGVPVPSTYPRT